MDILRFFFFLGVPCVLYMLSALGPRHTVNITENSSLWIFLGVITKLDYI